MMATPKRKKITFAEFEALVKKCLKNNTKKEDPNYELKNLFIHSDDEVKLSFPEKSLYLENCMFDNTIRLHVHSLEVEKCKFTEGLFLTLGYEQDEYEEEHGLHIYDSTIDSLWIEGSGDALYECYMSNSVFGTVDFSGVIAGSIFHDFGNIQIKRSINMAYAKNPDYIICEEKLARLIRLSNPVVPISVYITQRTKSKPRA